MTGKPVMENSRIVVLVTPGLGVDLVEDAIVPKYPSSGNIAPPDASYDFQHVEARAGRARWLSGGLSERAAEYR